MKVAWVKYGQSQTYSLCSYCTHLREKRQGFASCAVGGGPVGYYTASLNYYSFNCSLFVFDYTTDNVKRVILQLKNPSTDLERQGLKMRVLP